MTTTRSCSASNHSESVVARVRRSPRAAAVDARRRISEMAAEAFEEPSAYVRPAPTQASVPASMNHRYMLRSMRRQEQ